MFKKKDKIIKTMGLNLGDKDTINLETMEDFLWISKKIFRTRTPIFDLDGVYYLIGSEVIYCFRYRLKPINNIETGENI